MSAKAPGHHSERPTVTIIARAFPPAYLFGGPVRSLDGIVSELGDEFDFRVVTSCFDAGRKRLDAIESGCWSGYRAARVFYASDTVRDRARQLRFATDGDSDLIYLNSLFDVRYSLLPLLANMLRRSGTSVLLAPRGELSPAALNIKRWKKLPFLVTFRMLRLHRRVTWHATSEAEADDIRSAWSPSKVCVLEAPPLSAAAHGWPRPTSDRHPENPAQRAPLRVVFFSRISRIKNLECLLEAAALTAEPFEMTIAGPVEDSIYWEELQDLLERARQRAPVTAVGPVEPSAVLDLLSSFELFVLPSRSENFGHAIVEALTAGCPAIVGLNTPWSKIESSGAGWLCNPDDPPHLASLIDGFAELSETDRLRMRDAAFSLARSIHQSDERRELNRRMFSLGCRARTRKHLASTRLCFTGTPEPDDDR